MQDENPYQSPKAECFIAPTFQVDPSLASAWQRLTNLLLDYLGYMVLVFAVGLVLDVLAEVFDMERVIYMIDKFPSLFLGLPVYLLYYITQEGLLGKTLAKFVTGTRVVSSTGAKPTFGQIVGRTFCRLIPLEQFSFFKGKNPVGWHDKISHTLVILDR